MIKMRLERNFRNVLNAALGDYLRRDGTLPMTGNLDMDGHAVIMDVDGDTYFISEADENISVYFGGSERMVLNTSFFDFNSLNGPRLIRSGVNATTPNIVPKAGDLGTGMAHGGVGQPSMTGNNIESQRWIPKVDTDSDLNDILLTGVSGFHGIALVTSLTDNVSAIYHIDNVTITGVISANALFSNTPGNAGTYNFYYNVDQFKLENKVGNDKSVQVIFWVVPT